MSFDRPHYFETVLRSLRAQTVPIANTEIFLFQDGYRSRTGADLTDPRRIERCMELFAAIFPGCQIFSSDENLGVAFNFARAEDFFFNELGAEAAFFFEDDLLLSPHYLTALHALTEIALTEKRIAYVAAYGNHHATLDEQRLSSGTLTLMHHKWGFALTRRQWLAQRDILQPYLEIVARGDYRDRDHAAIREYFRRLGYASEATSQDAMKAMASCVLGTAKVMTFACFGKYIGEVGLHWTKPKYDEFKYGDTEIYPDEVISFEAPGSDQLSDWINEARVRARNEVESAAMTEGTDGGGASEGLAEAGPESEPEEPVRPAMTPGLEIDTVADGYVVYQPDRDKVHYLNPTAVLVLELCDGRNPEADLPRLVQLAYDLPQPPVQEVAECLETLRREGLIQCSK
jgi:hypothetical protein